MTEDESDRKAMSAAAAKRLYIYVKSNDLPAQVAMDIGVVIGRLSYLEGPGWQTSDWNIPPDA
jgi:hypothetical protein